MSLVSLLATTTLITLANSTPMIYAANQKAKIPVDHDHLLLILLLNRKDFGLKSGPLAESTGGIYATDVVGDGDVGYESTDTSSLTRDKRIGSLSIVNSVDVLRQRVLLELARRKAMEDQRQISENRRILDSVGKRSESPGSNGFFAYRDRPRLQLTRKKRLSERDLDEDAEERRRRLERLLLLQ